MALSHEDADNGHTADSQLLHASAVAIAGRGLLVVGPSGSGKSSLALALMGMGAMLVADDRTVVTRAGEALLADAPDRLRGLIEARHVGLLAAEAAGPVPVALVVDLSGPRAARLPGLGRTVLCGIAVPRVTARFAPELAPALRQLLIGGLAP